MSIEPGDLVRYAEAPYRVVAVEADLLVLMGVVDWQSRTVRERCVVLASDVTLLAAAERPLAGRRGRG